MPKPILNVKRKLLYLLLIVAVAGCKKESKLAVTPPVTKPTDTTSVQIHFSLKAEYNPKKLGTDSVKFTTVGDSIFGVVPASSNERSFALSFSPFNADVKIDGVKQLSGMVTHDFTNPVSVTYTNNKGVEKTYKIKISNFTGIPILNLTTAGPVVSKDDYVDGSLIVNSNGKYELQPDAIPLQIKGRGNSTWDIMPKKPYRLKFKTKTGMLGLPAAKNWVLLANYSDKTLVRNSIAFEMAHQFGSDYAPHGRYVEVFMNKEYLGSYTLCEQVELNPGRVDITELKPKDNGADVITGGYLLELDQRLDADKYFWSSQNLPFTIKSPDAISDAQLAYISGYVNQMETALFSNDFADPEKGYAKYINVDSFIAWFLVKEIMKDSDAKDFSSDFYYKERGGKLGMGPVWDFDLSGGNTDYTDAGLPTGWWIKDSKWFSRLFQDPAFKAKVRARWTELKVSAIPNIFASIDRGAAYLDLSQQQNFKKWDILGIYVWPNTYIGGTYPNEVNHLKEWLHTRIDWMDANL